MRTFIQTERGKVDIICIHIIVAGRVPRGVEWFKTRVFKGTGEHSLFKAGHEKKA